MITWLYKNSSSHPGSMRPIVQYRLRRIMPRRTHHSTARMYSRSAQIQSLDWSTVASTFWRGAQGEDLIWRDLTLEDIAIRQPIALLDVNRAEHHAVDHGVSEVRSNLGHRSNDTVGHFVLHLFRPLPALEMIRRILAEQRGCVEACWGHRWVSCRLEIAFNVWLLRELPSQRILICLLNIVRSWGNIN